MITQVEATIPVWASRPAASVQESIHLKSASELPGRIREVEHLWIPLSDGCRLAARLWFPEDAEASPVPAILEYIPYRKRDGTSEHDELMHPYFASHGYAALRVDLRGSGDSEGLLRGEYLKQEQDDCLEVIAWLARQPWCSGVVGMLGISWGGFNSLQVAARQPPALKAIITLCSTDDRYADDIHFMGGALLTDNLRWGSTFFAQATRPPDPELVGEAWRAMWLDRLRDLPLFAAEWLRHQRRDDFWQHGSVCENYAAIQCPVYAVGGWIDGYSNAVLRLMEKLTVPRKGLIGPWAHHYPMVGMPGPQIGFLQEALRWWDKWLKGLETGIMNEPMLRVWMQESVRPAARHENLPGRWVAESTWPVSTLRPHRLYLHAPRLDVARGKETACIVCSPEDTGMLAGIWCPYDVFADEASDQREDDARSLVFDTEPLSERVEILGAPTLEIEIASDRPNAKLVARLCDVHPDGTSTRISYAVLNLTHRDSHAAPAALEPGRRYGVTLRLNDAAYAFPPGHRIRLALSTAYWPITWPSPERVMLTVFAGQGCLSLPERLPRREDEQLVHFLPAEAARPCARTVLRPSAGARAVCRDLAARETISTVFDDFGQVRVEATHIEMGSTRLAEYRIADNDPLSARMDTRWTMEVGRGDWRARSVSRAVMTASREQFRIQAELDAFEGEQRICARKFDVSVARDLV